MCKLELAGLDVLRMDTSKSSCSGANRPLMVRAGGLLPEFVLLTVSPPADLLLDLLIPPIAAAVAEGTGLGLPRGKFLFMSSLRLSPLPDFLRGDTKCGEADAGNVGEGALSMPDADVTGIAAAELNLGDAPPESGLLLLLAAAVAGESRVDESEILRMRGVDDERGTGSGPEEER